MENNYLEILTTVDKFITKDGEVGNNLSSVKIIGIYFTNVDESKNNTPKLIEFYNEINKNEKQFEIIYMSMEEDENEFKNSLSSMPWLSLPIGDYGFFFADNLKVRNCPHLSIINSSGRNILRNAIDSIQYGKESFEKWINYVEIPLDSKLEQKIESGEEVISLTHPHPLKKVGFQMKGREEYSRGWFCNECSRKFECYRKNLFCGQCFYDLCDDCFVPSQ